MAEIKRSYTVPLRREFLKAPRYNKTKKAVKALQEFLAKHMKVPIEKVRIGDELNKHLWKSGIRSPPPRVKIDVIKDEEGMVFAQLEGIEYKRKVKEEEKGKLAQMVEKVTGKKTPLKAEEAAQPSSEKKEATVDAEFSEKKVKKSSPAKKEKSEAKTPSPKPVAEKNETASPNKE